MNARKPIRIVLAVLCLVTILGAFVFPITNRYELTIPDLLDSRLGDGESVFIILLFLGMGLMVFTAIFAFIFPVRNKVPGIMGIISAALAMSAWLIYIIDLLSDGWGELIGVGAYLGLLLSIGILVLSIVLLKTGNRVLPDPARSYPEQNPQRNMPQQGYSSNANNVPRLRPMGSACIAGLKGPYNGASFDISNGAPVLFGRDASVCSVIFDQNESAISRRHCTVTFKPYANMYSVKDESRFGTYLGSMNNRLPYQTEVTVSRGSVLYLGSPNVSFRLE